MQLRKRAPLFVLLTVITGVGAVGGRVLEAGAAPAAPTSTPVRRAPTATGTPTPTPTPSSTPSSTQTAPPASSSAAPAPTGKPDLKCEILAYNADNTPVANGGTVKPIIEANGFHSLQYALRVKNEGGPTGAAFQVRYDYVQKIGSQTFTSSKPNIPWVAMTGGQEITTPKLKVSASGPFPNDHEIMATIDTGSQIDELNETNNTCKISLHLQ